MSRILVVEDEEHLATGLRFNLELEGHDVTVADTGEAALAHLVNPAPPYDLVLLDVMLPGTDGFQVVRELRDAGRFVPVLMLTARGRAEDVLTGFEAGADDYLPKPFDLPILIARVRGLLRRREWARQQPETETSPASVFEFGGRKIDFDAQELEVNGETRSLTLMETNLLRYLVRNEGKPVSRKALLEEVWGVREDTDTRAIDNFIVRLRRYIEDEAARPRFLVTVRGVGYRFTANPEE
ncbi:MAG: response regulator transcription factor [Bryobacterales bacterium]